MARNVKDEKEQTEYFVENKHLNARECQRKYELEHDPSSRSNCMEYMADMEQIDDTIRTKVLAESRSYEQTKYTKKDVERALEKETCEMEDFKALLSDAATPYIEEMAQKAKSIRERYFGKNVLLFTPLYLANYCENYCVYCGFNCYNDIQRKQLSEIQMEEEMAIIARSGMEEILLLTGESEEKSNISYIKTACALAKKYFKNVGVEVYPMNTDAYKLLQEAGADFVTVFQETYDIKKYETLHLAGKKRVFPYRFESQERAILGGMRGVGFSALLGLSDYKKDALASALHVYYLQRKYPQIEYSLSCPRLRPIVNNAAIHPKDVHEKQLLQILCAYRIFLPFAGITVSSRESKEFRNGIVKIAATKVSAGVSTGIGEHKDLYEKDEKSLNTADDTQFEIADTRSVEEMYHDLKDEGMQPVMNDYIYV